jgi:hypothetical protein
MREGEREEFHIIARFAHGFDSPTRIVGEVDSAVLQDVALHRELPEL